MELSELIEHVANADETELFPVKSAAIKAGISEWLAYESYQKGELPVRRVGTRVFTTVAACAALGAERERRREARRNRKPLVVPPASRELAGATR